MDQLVEASEATPDLGFMARLLALCSLPRTNPGDRLQYKRVNGPYTLVMFSNGETKLPYGNIPRLLMAWSGQTHRVEEARCPESMFTMGRNMHLACRFTRLIETPNH